MAEMVSVQPDDQADAKLWATQLLKAAAELGLSNTDVRTTRVNGPLEFVVPEAVYDLASKAVAAVKADAEAEQKATDRAEKKAAGATTPRKVTTPPKTTPAPQEGAGAGADGK